MKVGQEMMHLKKQSKTKINLTLFEVPFYTVTFEQVLNQKKGDSQADEIIYHKGVVFVHEFQKMIGKDKLLKIVRETYSVPNHFVTLKDFENSVKANDCWNEYLKLYEIEL
jgi:aminopeptidase N